MNICNNCDEILIENSRWCMKCQQASFEENFNNWSSGNNEIDAFIKETQMNAKNCDLYLEWIPFKSFINAKTEEISEVGKKFSANWERGPFDIWDPIEKTYSARDLVKVSLITVGNSPKLVLNELEMHYNFRTHNGLTIRLFGLTKLSLTNEYALVAETVEWDVRHYMSHHHLRLSWPKKLSILHTIACALELSKKESNNLVEIIVNELGFSNEKDKIPVIGNYAYDLLPFIAPEIIHEKKYNSKVDVYTFGMLMWEFVTNRPPFYDKPHDLVFVNEIFNGLRPTVDNRNIPECYSELMKKCWSVYPQDRPTISEIVSILSKWHIVGENKDVFLNAESKRIKKIKYSGLNPDPIGKMVPPPKIHPQAIYTSRLLKFPALDPDMKFQNLIRKNDDEHEHCVFKDESFFASETFIQHRKTFPEESENEDEDLNKQYELKIPETQ